MTLVVVILPSHTPTHRYTNTHEHTHINTHTKINLAEKIKLNLNTKSKNVEKSLVNRYTRL